MERGIRSTQPVQSERGTSQADSLNRSRITTQLLQLNLSIYVCLGSRKYCFQKSVISKVTKTEYWPNRKKQLLWRKWEIFWKLKTRLVIAKRIKRDPWALQTILLRCHHFVYCARGNVGTLQRVVYISSKNWQVLGEPVEHLNGKSWGKQDEILATRTCLDSW